MPTTFGTPYSPVDFDLMRMPDAWRKYGDALSWGRGQTLAALDDGFNIDEPEYETAHPWGRKLLDTWDAIDRRANPYPVDQGYHGTTIIHPSSLKHDGKVGVAFNNQIVVVRSVTVVHLVQDESEWMARALQWVIDHRRRLNITAVNFAMLDDQPRTAPLPTVIDEKLALLRELNIWVSAPCGNNEYTSGISWPACQDKCYGIGATKLDADGRTEVVHRDRFDNVDILVPAGATSSSNAFICGASMILREAIEKRGFDWTKLADNLPDAMMRVFLETGATIKDKATGKSYQRLDMLAALDRVWSGKPAPRKKSKR